MILYDLKCPCGQEFEAWFRDSAGYEEQRENGGIDCPTCGSNGVSKALMAPNISIDGSRRDTLAKGETMRGVFETLAKLRNHVESSCDYVGPKFAEEARKIHYGEVKDRAIYGEATSDESEELHEEGIEFVQLPFPRHDA